MAFFSRGFRDRLVNFLFLDFRPEEKEIYEATAKQSSECVDKVVKEGHISFRPRIRPVHTFRTLVGSEETSVGVQSSERNTYIVSFVGSKYLLFRCWLFLD
jgi:hypothetical protein